MKKIKKKILGLLSPGPLELNPLGPPDPALVRRGRHTPLAGVYEDESIQEKQLAQCLPLRPLANGCAVFTSPSFLSLAQYGLCVIAVYRARLSRHMVDRQTYNFSSKSLGLRREGSLPLASVLEVGI